MSSSSSELLAAENTGNISIPENKEISPSSSETKAISKKRRLEKKEDSLTEQGSGQTIAGTSVGPFVSVTSENAPPLSKAGNKKRRLEEDIHTEEVSGKTTAGTSVGSSILAETSPKVQGRELTLLDRPMVNEPSRLDSFTEVDGIDDGTGDSSTISIAAAATPATSSLILLPTPIPISHAISTQVSSPVAGPPAEPSSGHTASDLVLPSPPLTQVSDSEPPPKKARLDIEPAVSGSVPAASIALGSKGPLVLVVSDTNTTIAFPKPSPFVALPVELLSEILIYTGSPQYVLAVARTCKALCQTLLSTNNQFIWRLARRACVFDSAVGPVYLPDPPQDFFGEAAYAAFLFDPGACDVCGNETSMMYASFALRLRICKEFQCRHSATQSIGLLHAPDHAFTEIIPFTESPACFDLSLVNLPSQIPFTYYPHFRDYCRALDFLKARTWIEHVPKDDDFRKRYESVLARNVKWMEFAVSVHKWSRTRQAQYYTVKRSNDSQSRKIADKFGWDRSDMINTTIYGDYHKQRNKVMENVEETDVRVMVDQIESQLVALAEKRGRHAAEAAFLENRNDVEKYYNSILSKKVHPILPSLPTFRQLPIIKLLQSGPATKGITIAQTLASNSLMGGLLSNQLNQWVETAKEDFAVLLGFPKKWKKASKNVLHPVERATARFRCIRCVKVKGGSRTDDGCLDFEAACRHVCMAGPGRIIKGKRGMWDVSNFAKDEKAIDALNKIIQALGYSEDKDGARTMISLGLAVLCTSCDPPMILDSRSVVGHCHRHDAMELSLTFSVETITSYLGGYPFTFGFTERLLGSGRPSEGKKAIGSKNYGCRHCLRAKQVEPVAVTPDVAAENEGNGGGSEEAEENEPPKAIQVQLSTIVCRMHDQGIQGPRERPPPLFNFNGMRSHLKAKHRIETIRDEDFLCYDAVDL